MKIVILDANTVNPGDLTWKPLEKIGELTIYPRTTANLVVERCKDADVVLTNKVVFDANTINQLSQLKYIGVLATGYNVVDLDAATQHGITVTNIPAYSTDSVAQMVWAHILNITNQVAHYAEDNRNGRWTTCQDFCYYDFPHIELSGKNMGIVGLGNTGMAVARIALAFNMKVLAYTSKKSLPAGITSVSVDKLFSESDIISLHCPLTPSTHHLVDTTRISFMKNSAILINASRGPVVDDSAVAQALHDKKIAAYGADVLTTEPPKPSNPLLNTPNCYLTPHIAWATIEARTRLIQTAITNIKAFDEGKPINKVN